MWPNGKLKTLIPALYNTVVPIACYRGVNTGEINNANSGAIKGKLIKHEALSPARFRK